MENKLTALSIDTQKDEIIARLILQKCVMYVRATEGWLEDFLSIKEAEHVVNYAVESDKVEFAGIYHEILDVLEVLQ